MGNRRFSQAGEVVQTWSSQHKILLASFITLLSFIVLLLSLPGESLTALTAYPQQALCGADSADATRHPNTFVQESDFWDMTAAGNEAWEKSIPDNGGFVPFRDEVGVYVKGISMFHQLHCLAMIRGALQRTLNEDGAMEMGGDDEDETASGHDHHSGDKTHWVHCLDYIRQVSLVVHKFNLGSLKIPY